MRRLPLLVLALVLAFPAAASAEKPSAKTLYEDGPEGRYLLDGEWLFRLDNEDQGIAQRFMRSTSTAGWTKTTVPSVWNLGDGSNESMAGGIGWYRKDFELPDADSALAWALRFESVNYRTQVWINGRPIGENTGAYIPFEFAASSLKRSGTNRLVVRVDSRRLDRDFPPARPEHRRRADRRLVELLRDPARGLPAQARHGRLPARSGAPGDRLRHVRGEREGPDQPAQRHAQRPAGDGHRQVRRPEAQPRHQGRSARAGSRRSRTRCGSTSRGCGRRRPRTSTTSASRSAKATGKVAGYTLHSGIRSIKVSNGRLVLNGQFLNLRGVGLHEESKAAGFAIDNARRDQLVNDAKALGATVLRTHYPLHPVHARAGRPARAADLVGDPGLLGQRPRSSRSRRFGGSRSRS